MSTKSSALHHPQNGAKLERCWLLEWGGGKQVPEVSELKLWSSSCTIISIHNSLARTSHMALLNCKAGGQEVQSCPVKMILSPWKDFSFSEAPPDFPWVRIWPISDRGAVLTQRGSETTSCIPGQRVGDLHPWTNCCPPSGWTKLGSD